ncbi:hypothetical protein [Permianibacter aggregans]|uniref:Uncharacterized protein n=1 Tax=Permianibacter aggregans TaxID=1510150 RepID=A0A4R6UAN4_9GAMM|nr:hypothetical protein [Permianibacter aggregans]QGX40927.1 hypothetical protein E2H98_15140 [Permianibacter aggregans]TDQ41959.1 hypothetical protein EV696_1362 [Permianibacter aggregans]
MQVQNNPAGRLHDILSAARQHPPKEPARKVWASIFDITPEDTGTLLKMLADLIDLVHETKAAIQKLDDVDQNLHLKPFKRIESALSTFNLDASWEHWKNQIDDSTLLGLQFSADKLSRLSGTTSIPNDELANLRSQLDALIGFVAESSLVPEIKIFMLRHLERLRHALLAYRVRGLDGLQEGLETIVGSFMLNSEAVKSSATTEEEKEAMKKIFNLIDQFNKVVSFARNAKELASPAIQLLTQLIGP